MREVVDHTLVLVDRDGWALPAGEPTAVRRRALVPAGTEDNILGTGSVPLLLSTVSAPPWRAPGTVLETKE